MDKRIIKTKKSIMTAFMQLASEMDTSKITISDLSERALINRSTFYLHYEDIQSVVKDIEAEFAQTVSACIQKFDANDVYGSVYGMLTSLADELQKESVYKQYIVCKYNYNRVSERLKEILVERTLSAILQAYPAAQKQQLIYPLSYAAAGIVDCFIKWARSDDNSTSLEALIEIISELTEALIKNLA